MIEVTYRFPAHVDAAKQAEVIAVGQTAGSWGARFVHREPQLRAHLGQVLGIERQADGASLARIGFPVTNTESDSGTLLTMIFGKYSLAGPARIVDLCLPSGYGTPAKFGVEGLRRLTQVHDRPLFMGIFKPALGLTADDHAALLREVAGAGLDLIKDDEILGNLAEAPTLARVRACRAVIDETCKSTGREILYAVNLTGRADRLNATAHALIAEGANALLFNALVYGYPALEALAADTAVSVPIFTHPALAGALGGPTDGGGDYGIDYPVLLGTLMRHAGADAVLYPAHYGSLPFAAATEFRIRDRLREPLPDRRPAALPVPSAGIHPGVLEQALHDYGDDVVLNAGTAIFDHPQGPAAGVCAFFAALETVRAGRPLRADSVADESLRVALQTWAGTRERKH
ncbi:MAG: 2,3-diketo-5-methylthiopentyl-1-phosphate enolase [Gammaproteobacteria bacterium]|nr:2,3-diketo-5-methylthiopentyl-1-phosphate enolase [Gammaproteobacteria bacterium]